MTLFKVLLKALWPIAAFVLMAYILGTSPEMLQELAASKNLLIGLISALILAPLWTAKGRLSAFDKTDGLAATQRQLVDRVVLSTRDDMLRVFGKTGLMLVIGLVALSFGHSESTTWVLSTVLAAFLTYSIMQMLSVLHLIMDIERLRVKVAEWQRQAEARTKLLASLRKDRQESPLEVDDHLRAYISGAGTTPAVNPEPAAPPSNHTQGN
jgi:hypothetical protein